MQLAMTRPIRQVLATILMLGGTVVPTLIVGALAWRLNQPGHVRDVEVQLSRELGVRVTLDAVRYPQPGTVVYQGVVVRIDDTRSGGLTEIARADYLSSENSGNEVSVLTEGLTLRGESPKFAVEQLSELIQKSGKNLGVSRVGLSAHRCKIEPGMGLEPVEVEDLAVSLSLNPDSASNLEASLQVRNGKESTRCELALRKLVETDTPATSLTIKTMTGPPISAKVLTPFFTVENWLGNQAKVSGALTLRQAGDLPWTVAFQGDLTELDLGKLVSKRFPDHELLGRGKLAVKSALWADRAGQGPGWVEIKGRLEAEKGSIGRNLLISLQNQMRFRLVPAVAKLEATTTKLDFHSFGVTFELKPSGEIEIAGGLGGESPADAVLIASNEVTPLVYAPNGASNVRGLIKALYPARAETLMPVTTESQSLQRYLPLPVASQAMVEPRLKAQ